MKVFTFCFIFIVIYVVHGYADNDNIHEIHDIENSSTFSLNESGEQLRSRNSRDLKRSGSEEIPLLIIRPVSHNRRTGESSDPFSILPMLSKFGIKFKSYKNPKPATHHHDVTYSAMYPSTQGKIVNRYPSLPMPQKLQSSLGDLSFHYPANHLSSGKQPLHTTIYDSSPFRPDVKYNNKPSYNLNYIPKPIDFSGVLKPQALIQQKPQQATQQHFQNHSPAQSQQQGHQQQQYHIQSHQTQNTDFSNNFNKLNAEHLSGGYNIQSGSNSYNNGEYQRYLGQQKSEQLSQNKQNQDLANNDYNYYNDLAKTEFIVTKEEDIAALHQKPTTFKYMPPSFYYSKQISSSPFGTKLDEETAKTQYVPEKAVPTYQYFTDNSQSKNQYLPEKQSQQHAVFKQSPVIEYFIPKEQNMASVNVYTDKKPMTSYVQYTGTEEYFLPKKQPEYNLPEMYRSYLPTDKKNQVNIQTLTNINENGPQAVVHSEKKHSSVYQSDKKPVISQIENNQEHSYQTIKFEWGDKEELPSISQEYHRLGHEDGSSFGSQKNSPIRPVQESSDGVIIGSKIPTFFDNKESSSSHIYINDGNKTIVNNVMNLNTSASDSVTVTSSFQAIQGVSLPIATKISPGKKIYSKNYIAPRSTTSQTTAVPEPTSPAPTSINSKIACERQCIRNAVSQEYDPVCGNDGRTYSNKGKLRCTRVCGKTELRLDHFGNCGNKEGQSKESINLTT